ncbi:bifunctional adenosylcobinamide kinase/adenosylcobinamide-phosphate guanylyltransferase [Mesobacillus harenae]|uniref:bifunctional adenosylcobinamide kinase/adenosylcobinamide-phosphate guanylyltransferase n=1 Tax=Mesobacillus harenae TaxID=2213203 RepID=UPI00157FFCE2|nr:bifunctional adenosylcobinamide kinase/adenosylcobinamide-phosphate guanylyltransferase [Mesobacillus harenae]
MHFVTGGSFNGKAKWVREQYQLSDSPHLWVTAKEEKAIPENFIDLTKDNIIVLEGIEWFLEDFSSRLESIQVRLKWQTQLQDWLAWESKDRQRKLILIGTDISKGIVPLLPEDRKWRDVTGWAYQDTMKLAKQADLIWYGINKKLK